MELNRWKLIAGGAALIGVTVGGVAAADSDDGFELNDQQVIELTERRDVSDPGFDQIVVADDSPSSPDSPNESPENSPDSPFDSPVDEVVADDSPDARDSPNESPEDSPQALADDDDDVIVADDQGEDSPHSPADSPAGDDSPDGGESPDSPNSADS